MVENLFCPTFVSLPVFFEFLSLFERSCGFLDLLSSPVICLSIILFVRFSNDNEYHGSAPMHQAGTCCRTHFCLFGQHTALICLIFCIPSKTSQMEHSSVLLSISSLQALWRCLPRLDVIRARFPADLYRFLRSESLQRDWTPRQKAQRFGERDRQGWRERPRWRSSVEKIFQHNPQATYKWGARNRPPVHQSGQSIGNSGISNSTLRANDAHSPAPDGQSDISKAQFFPIKAVCDPPLGSVTPLRSRTQIDFPIMNVLGVLQNRFLPMPMSNFTPEK